MASDLAIEAQDLTKIYRSRWRGREIPAVVGLSLQVPQGVKFGLLGPNGAGKTTFVKMLLSAVHPTSGTARLLGRDSAEPEARRPVGYLPENHRFPTYLTGAGMLDFYGALSGVPASFRHKRVGEMLNLVGLTGWGDVRIRKYSKGMLQRLGLAQALLHGPRLLILDEPTDGVDPVGRREIRSILNQLTGSGVTVFINSHLLAEVEDFCDHVAILHKGRVALQGRVDALTAESGYTLTCDQMPLELIQRLRQAGAVVNSIATGFEVRAESREAINRWLDLIRTAGVPVDSLTGSSSSLEDVFIRVTAAGAGTAGERAA